MLVHHSDVFSTSKFKYMMHAHEVIMNTLFSERKILTEGYEKLVNETNMKMDVKVNEIKYLKIMMLAEKHHS